MSNFITTQKRFLLVIVLGVLILALFAVFGFSIRSSRIRFDNITQFAMFARQQGFYLHSGTHKPDNFGITCYVSDRPMDLEELSLLSVASEQKMQDWKGVVWVTIFFMEDGSPSPYGLKPRNLGIHWRVWGNLLAGGDPEFLDRIEKKYRQP